MILSGDVGGTSTRIALFEVRAASGALSGNRLVPVRLEKYSSRDHDGLESIIRAFMAQEHRPVDHACFGVAGPVIDGRVETPNLPWVVRADGLARLLGLAEVAVVNDLEANTHGIAGLSAGDLAVLNAGDPGASGNIAVISAGTGLGEAGAYWDGQCHHPFAGEGGHADFAPADDLQIELLRHLRQVQDGHVSWERIVSGPGLHAIYLFLRDTGRGAEPGWLAEAMRKGDPSAVISEAGLHSTSELCARALDLFVALYGAQAGNLALTLKATGGVFVGGGIAPKILERLRRSGTFIDAFVDKGRFRSMLERIPVRVILNDDTALLGAGRVAALRAGLLPAGPLCPRDAP